MPFTVQDFRSKLRLDGARPNLFECTMSFPTQVVTNPALASETFTFMCRASQLPGSMVGQVPLNYFGRELKFAGNRQFTEWTVTIINDEDFVARNAFEQWMNGLNSHVGNLRNSAMVNNADYQVDAFVDHYGKAGNVLKSYKMIGCFPIDVSPIDLDWAMNDTIEEYAVTFAYQWWEQLPGDAGAEYNVNIT